MTLLTESLLDKVTKRLGEPPSTEPGAPGSILTIAASRYSCVDLDEDVTQPTGFDPNAAALFEAVVEAAFLVANADGTFDEVERAAFKQVVVSACRGTVKEGQMTALLADLADLVVEDGMDKRVKMVARTIRNGDQAREVLRIAGLMAAVSGGVSYVEREVIDKLARELGLDTAAVAEMLAEVERSLQE